MKKEYKVIFLILMVISILLIFLGLYVNSIKSKNEIINQEKNQIEIVNAYNNPIIPEGFKKVETETASWELDENGNPKGWNEGLVIEDEKGNQFVWVPNNKSQIHDSNELIVKHSGFYISRYEAGLPEELQNLKNDISEETNNIKGIPVSKKGVIPWNYINIYNASYNAENMYPKNSNFKTALLDSNCVYIIYDWMLYIDLYNKKMSSSNLKSSSFIFTGYYSTDGGNSYIYGENIEKNGSMLLSTGASERNKIKNIYDFWGNLSDACVTRISEYGYIYANTQGDNYKMDFEHYYDKIPFYGPSSTKGYRIVLYLY